MIGRKNAASKDIAIKAAPANAHVWVLRDGHPESIPVKLGLSDGRNTEIMGEGLSEGLMIITRANTPTS
jgi:HlyD family secretion protein